jgi:hypothetical protein
MLVMSNESPDERWRPRPGTLDRQTAWIFRTNAVINLLLAARGIVDPNGTAAAFGGHPPNYPFLIRLWSGLVLMFGVMFWETSRDVRGKAVLIKYNWIEKTITATAVTLGYLAGDVPGKLMLVIVLTNWLWIPIIATYDLRLRRDMRSEAAMGAMPTPSHQRKAASPRNPPWAAVNEAQTSHNATTQ